MQTALALRQRRMELLATNIANADTPNYKARDFDFKQALADAMGISNGPLPPPKLTLTSERHIPGEGFGGTNFSPKYRIPYQTSMDGNTVEMDIERLAFADNTTQQQAGLNFVSSDIQRLMSALQPT